MGLYFGASLVMPGNQASLQPLDESYRAAVADHHA